MATTSPKQQIDMNRNLTNGGSNDMQGRREGSEEKKDALARLKETTSRTEERLPRAEQRPLPLPSWVPSFRTVIASTLLIYAMMAIGVAYLAKLVDATPAELLCLHSALQECEGAHPAGMDTTRKTEDVKNELH